MTETTSYYFDLIGKTTTPEECVQLIHDMLPDPKVSPIEYIIGDTLGSWSLGNTY